MELLKTCALALALYGVGDGDPEAARLTVLGAVESGCRAGAVSSAGARGWFQFMPATARGLWRECGLLGEYSEKLLHEPVVSLQLARCYLARLDKRYAGDQWQVLAHYNGGGRAAAAVAGRGVLWPETARYLVQYMRLKEVLDESQF